MNLALCVPPARLRPAMGAAMVLCGSCPAMAPPTPPGQTSATASRQVAACVTTGPTRLSAGPGQSSLERVLAPSRASRRLSLAPSGVPPTRIHIPPHAYTSLASPASARPGTLGKRPHAGQGCTRRAGNIAPVRYIPRGAGVHQACGAGMPLWWWRRRGGPQRARPRCPPRGCGARRGSRAGACPPA